MEKHSLYKEILDSLGWFDTGMGTPVPFLEGVFHVFPVIDSPIHSTTQVAYYPGCFAEFHDGHKQVVLDAVEAMKKISDDYRVIIAPANSDYTMSKYGDIVQASNEYRYYNIFKWLKTTPGLERVHIDLSPMLNFDRDHNFPDLIENFLNGCGLSLNTMHKVPFVVSGKDRNWNALGLVTKKLKVFYSNGDYVSSSSSIMKEKGKQKRVKKKLILRCKNFAQYHLFVKYFAHQYASLIPWYMEDELKMAELLIATNNYDFTICKDYAHILPYKKVSRRWLNPLHQMKNSFEGHEHDFAGKRVLDSDIFSGSTKNWVEAKGGKLDAVLTANPDNMELLDYNDFLNGKMQYPKVDVASRCSMSPFTKEDHKNFQDFLNVAMIRAKAVV